MNLQILGESCSGNCHPRLDGQLTIVKSCPDQIRGMHSNTVHHAYLCSTDAGGLPLPTDRPWHGMQHHATSLSCSMSVNQTQGLQCNTMPTCTDDANSLPLQQVAHKQVWQPALVLPCSHEPVSLHHSSRRCKGQCQGQLCSCLCQNACNNVIV